jgi:hypothetical protein
LLEIHLLYALIIQCNYNKHNSNEINNNNYGGLRDLILLLKILAGTRKKLFEMYRLFGHAPSKRIASPVVAIQEEIKGRRKSGNACYHSV